MKSAYGIGASFLICFHLRYIFLLSTWHELCLGSILRNSKNPIEKEVGNCWKRRYSNTTFWRR
ncbi:MAG: hypothetical protein CL916_10260 [Deltaproteobacteria bacterium]|nr:hypothetical protein [Deltaproteobacteria bacterium]